MPYIKQDRREIVVNEWDSYGGGYEQLDPPEEGGLLVVGNEIQTPGELNYAITKLLCYYVENGKGVSYTAYNEAIGVLECVKLEMYRRAVAPYEDEKAEENGDVY